MNGRSRRKAVLWALALGAVGACDGSGPTDVPDPTVQTVEVDPPQASLLVGDTMRLTARALDASGTPVTAVPVTWASETPGYVSVTAQGAVGRVTAVGAGSAVIAASAGGRTGRATIAVANPAPHLTTMQPATIDAGGDDFTLVVRGTGFVAASRVRWNGADRPTTFVAPTELEATIAAADIAAEGAATVTVVSPAPGGGASEVTFVVRPASPPPPPPGEVTSVEIDVDSLTLEEGAAVRLAATPRDGDGQAVPGLGITWTSTDPGVATVDALGGVTGLRPGTVTVTARVHGVEGSVPVRVWADYPYDLVYTGWDGADVASLRVYRTDPGDSARAAARVGPDAPSGGPVPSPDGTKLAYQLILDGGWRRLMVADRDGGGAVELHLTDDPWCGQVTWSPDGDRLAFGCRIGDNDPDIWVVGADGQGLVNITADHEGRQDWPSWSPTLGDGSTRIAYAQYVSGEPQIWTMKPDGSDARQVTTGIDWQPAWSPDGATIAFQRTGAAIFGDIWLVDAEGGNERALVGGTLAGPQDAPAWSPDGRLVAFGSTHEAYGSGQTLFRQIYTVWADGSKLVRRTRGDLAIGAHAWRVR